MDNTDLSFSSGGENPWFFQTAITHDGEDAMQSGIVSNGKASWISSTLMGPGNITFYWKINAGSNDKVVFTTDGIQNTSKFGNSDWSTTNTMSVGKTHINMELFKRLFDSYRR